MPYKFHQIIFLFFVHPYNSYRCLICQSSILALSSRLFREYICDCIIVVLDDKTRHIWLVCISDQAYDQLVDPNYLYYCHFCNYYIYYMNTYTHTHTHTYIHTQAYLVLFDCYHRSRWQVYSNTNMILARQRQIIWASLGILTFINVVHIVGAHWWCCKLQTLTLPLRK